MDTINPKVRAMEYAVRGAIVTRAGELETQLNDARNTMDKYLRDYDTLYQRTQKLTEDLEEQITKNQQQHLEGSWSASFFTPSTRLALIRECAGCFFERFRTES